jgi:type IV secretory pathway TrbF-like protein
VGPTIGAPVTPAEVRRTLGEHYQPEARGLLAQQLVAWQRGCYLSWLLSFVLAVGIVVVVVRSGFYPYPIVYDPDGRIIWHGQAATTREERFIDVGLLDWVLAARKVSDSEVQFHEDRALALAQVYGKCAASLKVYNKESIAAYKDKQRRVFVKIPRAQMSLTREAPDRVRVTWTEEWTPEYGYGSETHRFQAGLTYAWYAKPQGFTAAQARLNPRRLYITECPWDEIRTEAR